MKTTVEISDSLFQEAKRCAARKNVSFREIVEEGLRIVLRRETRVSPAFHLRDGSFGGEGVVESLSWPQIRERIYGGRGE